ncbi:TetR/AcrR family transcriptional regulator [Butyricicoccus pullicaecorum]|uniref:TetR family transcriptional regulator n=1 Tax=Butyricicoccus pullicaecorum TaxID=501571 RepID=A0A1Y4LJD9_9FIRM|nr:TetR/AcrR family transcriptional regulator [Butyricicoccus pullicaecorum]OUP56836.1 TetR family transcriptional regulator [Butyricicoccus pullicaecorum]
MEKETKGVRTKRQLYQCAMKLFRERGFDRVSVDEIVREAGMAKGTFYIYFNTKSDIILEMLRQYDTYYDQIMAGLPDDLSIDQQMEEIVKGACRFTEEVIGLDLIRVLYVKQLTEGQEHPGLLNEDRALFRILSELLTAGQRAGIYDPALDVPDTTRLILHGIRASFFEWCSGRGQFDLTQECLYFLHTFCRGIYHTAK